MNSMDHIALQSEHLLCLVLLKAGDLAG